MNEQKQNYVNSIARILEKSLITLVDIPQKFLVLVKKIYFSGFFIFTRHVSINYLELYGIY